MPGQTELRPVRGACRHLRARYKIQKSARSPFPDLELIRYECEQARNVETDEDMQKCVESLLKCWQEAG